MATTTITGRFFYALGSLLTSSIYDTYNNDKPNVDNAATEVKTLEKEHIIYPVDIEGESRKHKHTKMKDKRTKSNYTDAAMEDLITELPGLQRDPGFNQFSGYIDASPSRHIFYWYVESQSNPEKDPVVLWTNGGPGCSGLLGFGTEHGPFEVDGDGNLIENEYSWNRIANMLYVEQPAGVGFSYFDNEEDKTTGDDQAARDNYQFILNFLEKFPERKTNDFYIASESYGGHYMPELAMEILRNDFHHELINFKGMMVGNPYVDPFSNTITQIRAYYNHGLIAKPLFDQWVAKCEKRNTYQTEECQKINADMFDQVGPGINPYALDYPVCFEQTFLDDEEYEFDREHANGKRRLRHYKKHKNDSDDDDDDDDKMTYSSEVQAFLHKKKANDSPAFLPAEDDYKPCSQVFLERYLNHHLTRKALHVKDFASYRWSPCTDDIDYSDDDFWRSVINEYEELIKMTYARSPDGAWINDLNILIFSGDDDSIASTAGTQFWIWDLGIGPVSHDEWHAWNVNNQTAGFVVHFKLPGESNSTFIFATVHGAGHEVPAYRPMEALTLFAKYLDRTL